MNTSLKKAATVAMVAIFGLLSSGHVSFAQTATGTATATPAGTTLNVPTTLTEQSITDFIRELQLLLEQIKNDKTAQGEAKAIANVDTEHAGDAHGNNTVIDGEKPESEIENEIDNEVETESPESEKRDEGDSVEVRDSGDEHRGTSTINQAPNGGENKDRGGEGDVQSEGESN